MPASQRLYKEVARSLELARKQYQHSLEGLDAIRLVEEYLCVDFVGDNPNFKAERFKAAAALKA